MIVIVSIFLFAFPSAAITFLLRIDVLPALFAFVLFSDLLLLSRRLLEVPRNNPRIPISRSSHRNDFHLLITLLTWCAIGGVVFDAAGFFGLLLFLAPYGASLVLLDRLVAQHPSKRYAAFLVALFLIVVFLYTQFQWGGFGRLVIGGFVLAPVLVANARIDLGIRPIYFIIFAPLALYVAQKSRYGAVEGISEMFIGSAGHHLQVTHDVLQRDIEWISDGLGTFISQYLLLFLNWVPRELWPEKPIGVGLWSVDTMYGRERMGDEYSQSIGFLGEQYFYLGDLFWVGLFVVLVTLACLRTAVSRASYGSVAPVVIFDVNLSSFFWGGCASFGSRFWFMVVPALFICWLFHRRSLAAST
ncbi:hypothetical protein [Paracoccus tibetensis]|nr:hypothetical protein [Paracoccus tibetensis]